MTNQEIIVRWKHEPAPLLPMLHAFHDRDGYLSEDALRDVSKGLRIPLADLFGTVTFYHHFSRTPGGKAAPRVCDGPICKLKECDKLYDDLSGEKATTMPCAGMCDLPIPVLRGDDVWVGLSATDLQKVPTPIPPAYPGSIGECVFSKIREEGRNQLKGYERTGGFKALQRAVTEMTPEQVLAEVDQSGLAGRGGAGFPTGRKWRSVSEADGTPKTIVCNADEGEPGCFKDRALMDYDPYAMIEGMIIAAYATGAQRGFIYLRYEYPEIEGRLNQAIKESIEAGFLGKEICGKEFQFDLYVRRGAGAYICGEETSLLNSLEGKHPFPRNRPPYPVTHGYEDKPTAVNNVETLASVPPIIANGSDWYRGLGMGDHAGTKLISLSGDIQKPGNYEVPMGMPLMTLLNDWAGGPIAGTTIQAVTMAGLSGGFIGKEDFDVTLDEPSLRSRGSFLGAGGIMVFHDGRDMVDVARQAMSFFAHESCGKCFPCRIGTQRLTERLSLDAGPTSLPIWEQEVKDIGTTMKATSACGLGMAAPLVTESLMRYFPNQISTRFSKTK